MKQATYKVRLKNVQVKELTIPVDIPTLLEDDASVLDKAVHESAVKGVLPGQPLGTGEAISEETKIIEVWRDGTRVYPRERAAKGKGSGVSKSPTQTPVEESSDD